MTNTIKVSALWTLRALYKTLDSQTNGRYLWGTLFSVSLLVLIRVIIKRSYLEKTGSTLKINRAFFQTRTIEIADIEMIEIDPGTFSDSHIVLKDNKGKVKFNYQNVNDKDFNAVMQSLNVPVK
jgi:hypothetical protein